MLSGSEYVIPNGRLVGLAVDLTADERSQVSDYPGKEEGEHDRVEIFSQRELVLLELMDEDEEETEGSSRKGEAIVGSDEKTSEILRKSRLSIRKDGRTASRVRTMPRTAGVRFR